MTGPYRDPSEESVDLYPGLVVHDGRVSGSITIGRSRLPWWCLTGELVCGNGWAGVESGWGPGEHYGYTADDAAQFLHDLLDVRGEFARLLLVLADAKRCERHRSLLAPSWWETKKHRKRVADQLRKCLGVVES